MTKKPARLGQAGESGPKNQNETLPGGCLARALFGSLQLRLGYVREFFHRANAEPLNTRTQQAYTNTRRGEIVEGSS